MTLPLTLRAATVFAGYDAYGRPIQPNTAEAARWGTEVEYLSSLAFTSGRVYTSRASMLSDLSPGAQVPGLVIGDPTLGYDGLYTKSGGTGTGTWVRIADLPGFQYLNAVDAGAGTANAIQATTVRPVGAAGSQLIWMAVYEANSGSPVTVSFNGGAALTIKTASGNDVAPGGLVAGAPVLGIIAGTTFRLVSDQASAAIQALAEAQANRAEDEADRATAAASVASGAMTTLLDPQFTTFATAAAYSPAIEPDYIRTAGYSEAGVGGATYKKNGTGTAGAGGLAITLSGGGGTKGFTIVHAPRAKEIDLRAVGCDTAAANNRTKIVEAITAAGQGRVIWPNGTFNTSGNIDVPQGLTMEWDDKALTQRTETTTHLFNLKGDNTIIAPKINGGWNGTDAFNGFGTFLFRQISGARIVAGNIVNVRGDHYRIEDSSWIYVDDARGECARNVFTVNDDVVGTSHLFIARAKVAAYLNGFDAESDDDWPVVDVEVDIDWTQLGGSPVGSAVAFTRSASPASSFVKYKTLRIKCRAKDAQYGVVLRGVQDVDIETLVTRNCLEGLRGGVGHPVYDVRLHDFDIEARNLPISINNPGGGFDPSRGLRVGRGKAYGVTASSAFGVYSGAAETFVSADALIDMAGATGSIAVRLDGDMSSVHAKMMDARTAFVQLNGGTANRMEASGCIMKPTTGAVVNDISVFGSSPDIAVRDNNLSGTSTGKAIDDQSRLALVRGNRGGDLFRGGVTTTDATPTLIAFEGGRSYVPIAQGQAVHFEVRVTGQRSTGSAPTGGSYSFTGRAVNTSGTLALEGTIAKTVVGERAADAASLDASVALGASGIEVTVTGVTSQTHAWNATVTLFLV